jgi:8-oxo-dGTP pyrophosphatase MutT (NUDIX family)
VVEDYHVRETLGFVVIFALTPGNEVLVSHQYKYGIDRVVAELPGGAIDPGETPLAAAKRELVEETGYEVAELEFVRTFVTDPTNSNGVFHLFLGRDARPTGRRHPDPTEEIAVEPVSLERLRALVRDGTIEVAFHVASIYSVLERLGRLG